jgi:hypothetical protein
MGGSVGVSISRRRGGMTSSCDSDSPPNQSHAATRTPNPALVLIGALQPIRLQNTTSKIGMKSARTNVRCSLRAVGKWVPSVFITGPVAPQSCTARASFPPRPKRQQSTNSATSDMYVQRALARLDMAGSPRRHACHCNFWASHSVFALFLARVVLCAVARYRD